MIDLIYVVVDCENGIVFGFIKKENADKYAKKYPKKYSGQVIRRVSIKDGKNWILNK